VGLALVIDINPSAIIITIIIDNNALIKPSITHRLITIEQPSPTPSTTHHHHPYPFVAQALCFAHCVEPATASGPYRTSSNQLCSKS